MNEDDNNSSGLLYDFISPEGHLSPEKLGSTGYIQNAINKIYIIYVPVRFVKNLDRKNKFRIYITVWRAPISLKL